MGTSDDNKDSKKIVFVTVGTTLFDALVRAVDTPEVKQELYAKGFTHLLIQIGRGSYIPEKVFANFCLVFTSIPIRCCFAMRFSCRC